MHYGLCENSEFAIFQVARETGSVLNPIVLCECFEDATTSLIGFCEVAQETGSKQSHDAIRNYTDPV